MKKIITLMVILAMILQTGAVVGANLNERGTVTQNKQSDSKTFSSGTAPQEIWNKTYGDSGEEFFFDMEKTSDGGIVMAGENPPLEGNDSPPKEGGSLSNTDSQPGGWIVKVDKKGNTKWAKEYYNSDTTSAQLLDIIQTSDGGYIAVGRESNSSAENGFIVKTDSQGNEVWSKTFQVNNSGPELQAVTETSNGYVVTGYKNGGFIMKIDDNGNTVWTKTLGVGYLPFDGVVKAGNGYIAGGEGDFQNSNGDDGWLVKFDGSGNILWNRTLDVNDATIRGLEDAGSGKYAFTGNKNGDVWFGIVDGSGNVQWTNSIGGSDSDDSYEIIKTNKGFAIGGTTYSYGINNPGDNNNFWLLAVDGSGNERWNTTFGGTKYDSGGPLVKDGDNFYMAGQTESYDVGGGDGWLVKAGPPKPPTAKFSYSPSEVDAKEEITFDASSSSDPNNDITSYEWDFNGDGNTDATGKTTKYSFPQNGTYNVTLTVTDSRGNTDTTQKKIHVSAPNKLPSAKFNYSPKKPDPNQTVRFNASMSSDSDGSIASYNWEFNRSGFQISGKSVQYSFNQKGMHKVTLTVTDDDGATDKKSMTVNVTDADVNSAPQAKFKYSPKNPNVTDSIKFNASMSSDPNGDSLSYEWDFGDGDNSTGKTTTHKYSSSGEYTVELTVKDGNGASDKMNMTVNVTSSKLSIEEAIANLKSENDIVNFSELQSAINFWIQRREVPGTGGKKIDFSKLQDLISLWVQEKEV